MLGIFGRQAANRGLACTRPRAECGLTLVELIIAISIGAFIALAGTTLYGTTIATGAQVSKSAAASERINAILWTLNRDLKRAGYRGTPTDLSLYLQSTTGSAGVTGDEGAFPAVDVSTAGCILYTYATDYSCLAGDANRFTLCDDGSGNTAVGNVIPLYHRYGFRLSSGVMEAVATIHPTQFISPPPLDSSCTASGVNSAWSSVTRLSELYVDVFTAALHAERYLDADTGCILGTSGTDCETDTAADCGDTISCRIERLYKVTLCAYPDRTTDGLCVPAADGTQPDGQIFGEMFAAPRNDVIIARVY